LERYNSIIFSCPKYVPSCSVLGSAIVGANEPRNPIY
jgi:hypothetical protein